MQDQHRWGISTLGCPELSLPEAAALAERFGFRLLELRALSGNCKLAANLKLPENAGEFRRLAGEGRITLLGSGFGLSDPEADFRELEELSEIADAAGIAHIRIFGGMPFEHPVDDAAVWRWKLTTATLRRRSAPNSSGGWANRCRWSGMCITRSTSAENRSGRASGS